MADKRFMQPGQESIKKNIDDPLDVIRARIKAQFSPKPGPGPDTSMDIPIQQGREVPPLDPNVPQAQQDARINGMLAAAENMKRLKEKEAAQRGKYEAEDAAFAQREAEFDPSQYQEYKAPQPQADSGAITPPARFGGLKARMEAQQEPAVVEQAQGMIELSEDPEEMQRQIDASRLGR